MALSRSSWLWVTICVVSAKASSVPVTIDAYRRLADELPYALHIGVTEAGTAFSGTAFARRPAFPVRPALPILGFLLNISHTLDLGQ